jgi:asparagine synthase (glutamine-hydrolysing)
MCGIVGYISKNQPIDRILFEKMTDILIHRGPDERGTFYENNLALGHRRLSILDLSENGIQPMHYMDRYVIVLNGEIYNYVELKEELIDLGYSFNSLTDTEVVIASYDKWGINCLNKFIGMWAFVIYDRKTNKLFCSRDRFGVKPFYYYKYGDKFVFASEIKAILPCISSNPQANIPRVLDNILYGAFDHTNETLFKDIYQIRAGYSLIIDCNLKIEHIKYYDIEEITENKQSYENNIQVFKDLFKDSVRLRLRSDVPIGSCLSGGLDSSSIVCVAAKLLRDHGGVRHDTISSCYNKSEENIYDEQEFIDEIVKEAKTNSYKIFPNVKHFMENFNTIIYYQDEPVGGLCHEAQYNVFKQAKEQGITVMLDGQGADEQLAGYTIFHSVIIREYLKKYKLVKALKELIAFIRTRSKSEVYGVKGLFWFIIKDLFPPSFQRILLKLTVSRQEFDWIRVPFNSNIVSQMRKYSDFTNFSKKSVKYDLIQLLHFEDRNSMASGIEGRLPFLDYRLVEHIISLPPDQKIKNGITKRILRDSMIGILPEKIRTRTSKLGFAVPTDLWIMNYPELVKKELEISLDYLKPIIDKDKVLIWFNKNKENKIALTNPTLWRIISTGKWVNIFKVTF